MPIFPIRRAPPSRIAVAFLVCLASATADAASCSAQSGSNLTPVIELYTSQGCSSCPPADRWLSDLRSEKLPAGNAVIQAFHVAYWDYIGWVDPFAAPVYTQRQRQIAQWNRQRSIYTPQMVLDGSDWRAWRSSRGMPRKQQSASASITLRQRANDQFEASVTVLDPEISTWAAYWTVTEGAHQTRVKAGENAGEQLRNDHVVRQYTPAGNYHSTPDAAQLLMLFAIPSVQGHPRTINLVVFDPRNGKTLQALAAPC